MSDVVEQIRTAVEEERSRFGAPGCAVLVVREGEVLLAGGFGSRNVDAGLPVTAQTLFPIGSSTKTFTAALCASLVDEGVLEWDRPLRDYLPGFRLQDPIASQLLSARDCLSHRSGLPRHDMIWYADDGTMTRDDLINALPYLPPSKPFREAWQYNNLLYTTIGHLAGRLSGSSYEEAIRARLLDPLGMPRTNFLVGEVEKDADHARPYVLTPGEDAPHEVPFVSLDLAGPAGNINSCVEEMASWVLTLLGQGVHGRSPLLSAAVLGDLRLPTMPLPQVEESIATQVGYGLAHVLEDYRGHRVAHHGGNIDGFSSQVTCIPSAGIGVVVLTNLHATPLRDALPYRLFDLLLDLDARPHGERLHAQHAAMVSGMEQAKEARESKGLLAVRPLTDYVGRYAHPGYGAITVRLEGAELRATYKGLPEGRLEHRHLEVFDLAVMISGVEQTIPAQFTHDLLGEVDALAVQFEATLPALRFERAPETGHLTPEVLDRLAGTYTAGPLTFVVQRRGDSGLVVSVMGGSATEITPVRGTTFALQGQPLEFTDRGTLKTLLGELTRPSDDPS